MNTVNIIKMMYKNKSIPRFYKLHARVLLKISENGIKLCCNQRLFLTIGWNKSVLCAIGSL